MKKAAIVFALIIFSSLLLGCSGCGGGKITTYTIECELNGNVLSGKETLVYYNDTETAVKTLKFNLFANAYREGAKYSPVPEQDKSKAYPNGVNYGGIEIIRVFSGKKELDFSICGKDENILAVTLPEEVYPEEKYTLEIDYKLTLAEVISRTGINDKTINLATFYPILCARDENGFYECLYYSYGDPFYSDCADYQVTLSADSEYIVASSGEKVKSVTSGGKTKTTYKIKNARSFSLVLGKEFESVRKNVGGIDVTYYFYDDESFTYTFEHIVSAVKLFSEKFGKYPYKTYSVVQSEFLQGGMEYPGLVIISDDLEKVSRGEVAIHETAHQWWQTAVGNNEIEYPFLDEALAEYSTVIYYENYPEETLKKDSMIKSAEQTYRTFCSVSDMLYKKTDTSMLRPLGGYKSEYEYVNVTYIKGCLMFEYLRNTIGDEKFFGGLQSYFKEYAMKNATPDDMVGCFERQGADTNGFFNGFFEGKVII